MPKLTVRRIDSLKEPGMHSDGDGLYLRVGPTGSKSWVLRTVVFGNRRDLGIGSASLVTLSEAREAARQLRHCNSVPSFVPSLNMGLTETLRKWLRGQSCKTLCFQRVSNTIRDLLREMSGGEGGTRTLDPAIMSRML